MNQFSIINPPFPFQVAKCGQRESSALQSSREVKNINQRKNGVGKENYITSVRIMSNKLEKRLLS